MIQEIACLACALCVCVCEIGKKKFLEYKFYGTIIIIALGWYVWVDKIVIVKKGGGWHAIYMYIYIHNHSRTCINCNKYMK